MDDIFDETDPGEPLPEETDPGEPEENYDSPVPGDESPGYGNNEPPEEYEPDEDINGIEDAFENEDSGEPDHDDFFNPGGRENEPPGEAEMEDSGNDPIRREQPLDSSTVRDPTQISVEPFVPQKSPAAQVLGAGQPHKLNTQLILSIGLGTFAVIFVFATFVMPMFGRGKAETAAKLQTTEVRPSDYSSLVPRQYRLEEEDDLDAIVEELPPIDPRFQYEEPPPQVITAGSAPAGPERPDTRNDSLQGKSIAGIKGITPSQRNYMSGPGTVPYQNYQQLPVAADPANPYAQFGLPPKSDYTQQMLSMYQGANADPYTRQNDQSGKMQFYNQNRENTGNGSWLGPNTIWQGTIFEATLTSNINTDLPGEATAWVTKNIYSSLDGRYLLIPQNSRLFGTYNSSISYSQSRVQVGWHTLIRPDGYMINLGTMQAADPQGAAGIKGFINDHPFQYLKALALLSAFNILNVEFGSTIENTQNQYVQNVMANSQEIANTLGSKLIDRALDVQPTITIKAGTKINIVANTNLMLPPLSPYEVNMPYHKGE
jgi:type IV secretion system protein VirB10